MSLLDDARTVLFVHAHPDDETISTGALILELAARGIRVVLVTATRGERGEVVAGLRQVPGTEENALARARERELAGAVDRLGVSEAHFLGTPPARSASLPERRYRDSGMSWIRPGLAGPAADVPADALSVAPLGEIAGDLSRLIEVVGPNLVVSYDDNGGYGHPDHRRAREAALAAALESRIPFAEIVPEPAPAAEWFDLGRHLAGVQHALRSHATQLTVDGADIVHSGGQREAITTSVGLRRVIDAPGSWIG